MRSAAPPLLPIFRSNLQGRLLALLFSDPHAERSISEIARRLATHVATVQREVDRLSHAGVLRTEHVGRTRTVAPDPGFPFADELAALVLKVYGPLHVLGAVLRDVRQVERAYIYGSWAERFDGVPGAAPADLDVLIVGEPDNEALYVATLAAEDQLGLAVNIVVQSSEEWRSAKSGFLRTVKQGHLLPIELAA